MWTTESFAHKHNKKLTGKAAATAADQANAMLKKGVPENIVIATANKTGNRLMRKSSHKSSNKSKTRKTKTQTTKGKRKPKPNPKA